VILYRASLPVGISRYRALDRQWKIDQAAGVAVKTAEPAAP
jgi:hypothetical protein